jgi:hypothetical protein
LVLLASCQSGKSPEQAANDLPADVHKLAVEEVLQATKYTYLHGKDNGKDEWVAVPKMEAKTGTNYYFKGGIQMTKFESKDLNRTFESILFLEGVGTDPKNLTFEPAPAATADNTPAPAAQDMQQPAAAQGDDQQYKRTPPAIEKKAVKVEAVKGGITIAELFAKKDAYAGKTVRIKGQVTKYTPAVMKKNWIHIQDGTESGGKFDLAVTSDAEAQLGQTIVVEGKISLNKDLGYGYFFDVIMEDAAIK